jgi:hypothetical protein
VDPAALDGLFRQLFLRAEALSPREISNVWWALGQLGVDLVGQAALRGVLEARLIACMPRLNDFSLQSVLVSLQTLTVSHLSECSL